MKPNFEQADEKGRDEGKFVDGNFQNLQEFSLPHDFRGRPALFVQFWWICDALFFKLSPQVFYGWRRWILRRFGATIGKRVLIRSSATITYPWRVSIGDYSWIGDEVVLYSLGKIEIGTNVVVSQRSYLCAGDHDSKRRDFYIRARPIKVSDQAWIATDVFIGPDVRIGYGSLIGARSSVFSDMPSGKICFGSPCRPIKDR
jgi:putative colanic acid biosynthesis acetyltransferase WcaF